MCNKYMQSVISVFKLLKSIKSFDELVAKSIRIQDNCGYLLCVSELHVDDEFVIALMAKWRKAAKTFHDEFEVTHESTKRWLRKLLLDVPDRILFLVLNRHGHPIGHMGFANGINDNSILEIDNVIRGEHGQDKGLMILAMKSMLTWAECTFKPTGYFLRTFNDNTRAIEFYLKLGFKIEEKQKLPTGKIGKSYKNQVEVDCPNSNNRYLIYMNLNINDLK